MVIAIVAAGSCRTVPRATITPAVATRVLANRREVRLAFPTDPARAWGWPPRGDSGYVTAFAWGATVDGLDGPRSLVLTVPARGRAPRRFASLRELVAAGSASICAPGMIQACKPGIVASVDGSRVVLSLRDRPLIAQLFAMRPAALRVWRPGPGLGQFVFDSIAVEYVEPMIPEPDSALRAEAARRRRAYEASISWVSRHIDIDAASDQSSAWLAVGDSAHLRVGESQCHYDACSGTLVAAPDPRWTVDDPSVASVRVNPPATATRDIILLGSDSMYDLIGRAPGHTTLRVRFGTLPSDTLPSRTPAPHELRREIVVTLPIRRVTIEPRLSSVQVGQRVEFELIAIDTAGAELSGLPGQLVVDGGTYKYGGGARMPVLFDRPGMWIVIGRLGPHADTIRVSVAP